MRLGDVHDAFHLVYVQAGMDALHSVSGLLHSIQRLFVDIRRLNTVYLALERHNLGGSLL